MFILHELAEEWNKGSTEMTMDVSKPFWKA
jgi:hypothetical protein